MSDNPGGDRTEAPTPRRLQKAAEAGQRPVSSELAVCAALSTGLLSLIFLAPTLAQKLAIRSITILQQPIVHPVGTFRRFVLSSLWDALPLLVLPLLASVMAVGLQTGFAINLERLSPSFDRLNPIEGFRRLFSAQNLFETGKAVLKLAAVGTIVWLMITSMLTRSALAALQDVRLILPVMLGFVIRVCLAVLVVQAAVTIFDLLWTRLSFIRSLRMTRQEIKDETKESEGDPLLKSRLRQLRHQRARQRLRSAVPRATVVVTNPTEYAVALAYDRTRPGAPRVVAKGMNLMAGRIRSLAREHGIPLVANPPLARALYPLELEAEIPAEHYKAVAEIIAYVWRLRGQAEAQIRRRTA